MRTGLRPLRGLLRGGVLLRGEPRRRGGELRRRGTFLRGLRLRDLRVGGLCAGERERLRESDVPGGGDFFFTGLTADFFFTGLTAGLFDLLLALKI